METNKIIGIISLAIFIILNVIGFFILPDQLVVQVNLQGNASTVVSKFLGLIIIALLGVIISFRILIEKNTANNKKWFFAVGILLIVNILIFIFNL